MGGVMRKLLRRLDKAPSFPWRRTEGEQARIDVLKSELALEQILMTMLVLSIGEARDSGVNIVTWTDFENSFWPVVQNSSFKDFEAEVKKILPRFDEKDEAYAIHCLIRKLTWLLRSCEGFLETYHYPLVSHVYTSGIDGDVSFYQCEECGAFIILKDDTYTIASHQADVIICPDCMRAKYPKYEFPYEYISSGTDDHDTCKEYIEDDEFYWSDRKMSRVYRKLTRARSMIMGNLYRITHPKRAKEILDKIGRGE
jgi:hypothetical protein